MENYKFVDQIVINLWDWKKHGLLNLILIWNLLKNMVFIYYTIFNLQRITLTLTGRSISYENSYLIIFYAVSSKSISMAIFEKKITKRVTSSFIFFKSSL